MKFSHSLYLLSLLVSCIHAFTTISVSNGPRSLNVSPSGLHLFFGNNKKSDNKPASAKSVDKKQKQAPAAESTKKPFVFLYGKPRYDWVKNRPMTFQEMEQTKSFDWGAAPKTRSKK